MLLSIQQQYIWEVVRKLGYIRRGQLYTMMCRHFSLQAEVTPMAGLDAMLRQLRMGSQAIRLDADGIGLVGSSGDPRHLEAIDVMLELSEGLPSDFHVGFPAPRLLRFALNAGKMRLFTIANLRPGQLESVERQRMERIIWISDSGALPAGLVLPPKHFFAARQADGSHRFYGSEES